MALWDTILDTSAPTQNVIAGMPVEELLPPEENALEQPPAKVVLYDLAAVRARLAPYEDELAAMQAKAEALKVTDADTAAEATAMGVRFSAIEKAVETARASFKQPALDFGRSVDALAKVYTEKAQKGKGSLSRKVGAWQSQERVRELERLRKEQEEARALQAKIEEESKATGTAVTPVVMPKAAASPATVRTEEGKATSVTRWVCTVVDESKVPREYCAVSMPLLNAAVKQGIRQIPGCEIKQETTARFQA